MENGKQTGGGGGLGINFSKHGSGRKDKRRGVGEGVWANAHGGQSGKGVNSIRFRLRVGREKRRIVASFANDFAKKVIDYNPLYFIIIAIIMDFKWIIIHYNGF